MADGGSRRAKQSWWQVYRSPLSDEERQKLVDDPGPSWTQYFYYDFLRWWGLLGFFVVDALIVTSFVRPLILAAMIPSLVLATYLEYLGYEYLWYRPNLEKEWRRGPFHPTWYRPFRFGRWTIEGETMRRGVDPIPVTGPDPTEFL
ncbi:MAG TPA: hypothetical protein VGV89_07475 [Thermoplasmata archaeon]|nr:hypothetical protein [Thermoplasmata archaeon]